MGREGRLPYLYSEDVRIQFGGSNHTNYGTRVTSSSSTVTVPVPGIISLTDYGSSVDQIR